MDSQQNHTAGGIYRGFRLITSPLGSQSCSGHRARSTSSGTCGRGTTNNVMCMRRRHALSHNGHHVSDKGDQAIEAPIVTRARSQGRLGSGASDMTHALLPYNTGDSRDSERLNDATQGIPNVQRRSICLVHDDGPTQEGGQRLNLGLATPHRSGHQTGAVRTHRACREGTTQVRWITSTGQKRGEEAGLPRKHAHTRTRSHTPQTGSAPSGSVSYDSESS